MAIDSDIRNLSHAKEEAPEELELVREWWSAHGNAVTAVLVVLLVAVLGTRWWRTRAESREDAAMEQLQQAAFQPDVLERVAHEGKSKSAAALALLRLGSVRYSAGEFELAKAAYSDFLATASGHAFADVAEFGLAQCEEALGNATESVRLFREFAEKRPGSTLAPLATLGVARGLVLVGTDEARRESKNILELFLTEHAGEAWAASADELIRANNRLSVPERAAPASPETDIASFLSAAPAAEAAPEEAPAAAAAPEEAPAAAAAPEADSAGAPSPEPAPKGE